MLRLIKYLEWIFIFYVVVNVKFQYVLQIFTCDMVLIWMHASWFTIGPYALQVSLLKIPIELLSPQVWSKVGLVGKLSFEYGKRKWKGQMLLPYSNLNLHECHELLSQESSLYFYPAYLPNIDVKKNTVDKLWCTPWFSLYAHEL